MSDAIYEAGDEEVEAIVRCGNEIVDFLHDELVGKGKYTQREALNALLRLSASSMLAFGIKLGDGLELIGRHYQRLQKASVEHRAAKDGIRFTSPGGSG